MYYLTFAVDGMLKYILRSTALVPIVVGTKVAYDKYKEHRLDRTIRNASEITFCVQIKTDFYVKTDEIKIGKAHYGNGFVIEDNMILTCYHIVRAILESGVAYHICLTDKYDNKYKAEVVDYDKDKDLCLLKIHDYDAKQKLVPYTKKVKLGAEVLAVNVDSDEAEEFSVTYGRTNGTYKRKDKYIGTEMLNSCIHIPGGYSGTPLLTHTGKLLGINRGSTSPQDMLAESVSSEEIKEFIKKCSL